MIITITRCPGVFNCILLCHTHYTQRGYNLPDYYQKDVLAPQ